MHYIVLAKPYYEWIAEECRQVKPVATFGSKTGKKTVYLSAFLALESSPHADTLWMADVYTIHRVNKRTGLATLLRSNGEVLRASWLDRNGNEIFEDRKVPLTCLVEVHDS